MTLSSRAPYPSQGCRWRLHRCGGGCGLLLLMIMMLLLCIAINFCHHHRRIPIIVPTYILCIKNDTQQSVSSANMELRNGIASTSGSFLLHPHAWPAQTSQTDKICLSTFASLNKLHSLPWLLESWSGPLSVAVYTPGEDLGAFSAVLQYLRRCYPSIEYRVSFHLMYPKNQRPTQTTLHIDGILGYNCSDPGTVIKQIVNNFQDGVSQTIVKFPQNMLRNLARRSCDTPYGLVVDVDMIPSPFMFERISLMLEQNTYCKKCAFVIPVYEVDSKEKFLPPNKYNLLQMILEGKAQQYHIHVYDKNQGNSNLQQWQQSAGKGDQSEATFWSMVGGVNRTSTATAREMTYTASGIPYTEMYKIKTYEEFWEPIVVLEEDAPSFDERFLGFGFCRSSLIYELHVRGYSFRMLDEAFLSHWGFQTTAAYPAHRLKEIKENNIRYEGLKRELKARYTLPPPTQRLRPKLSVVRRPVGSSLLLMRRPVY